MPTAKPPLRKMHLAGVELYFDDLEKATRFYRDTLGLKISSEAAGHHAQFDTGTAFVCLERKGCESYPSRDKAVIFLEVADLRAAIQALGRDRILQYEPDRRGGRTPWAVLHDPEGHNVLLLEAPEKRAKRRNRKRSR